MAGRLEGKVAAVTGAANGLGAATVRRYREEGASVVLADIQDEAGEKLAAELGNAARYIHCDVTSEDDVSNVVNTAVNEFGRLDIMVNNAGIIGAVGSITETDEAAWDCTVAILLKGVFLGAKHAGKQMVKQKSGVVLSLASTAGVMGGLGPHCYTACKHAVVGFTKSIASEFAQHGVRANAVAPGGTVSSMTSALVTGDPDAYEKAKELMAEGSPLGFAAEAIDIANALLYLASEEARNVTGHTLVVDAGTVSFDNDPSGFHSRDADVFREAGKKGL